MKKIVTSLVFFALISIIFASLSAKAQEGTYSYYFERSIPLEELIADDADKNGLKNGMMQVKLSVVALLFAILLTSVFIFVSIKNKECHRKSGIKKRRIRK